MFASTSTLALIPELYLGALLASLTVEVRSEGEVSGLKSKYKTLRQALENHKWKKMSEGTYRVSHTKHKPR